MVPLDLEALRADTPACGVVNHLNNAGASPAPRPVLEAIIAYLHREALHGAMEAAEGAKEDADGVYRVVACLLGCDADEVAVVGSQSRGFQLALTGVRLRAGDRVITTPSEWGGNYVNLRNAAERAGASLEIAPVDQHRAVDPVALADMLDERVRLVSLTWIPANGGLINPAAAVGRILAGSDILYFVDAAQAVGQMRVDARAIGCDVMTASGRKWLRVRAAPRCSTSDGKRWTGSSRRSSTFSQLPGAMTRASACGGGRQALRDVGALAGAPARTSRGHRVRPRARGRRHKGPGDQLGRPG